MCLFEIKEAYYDLLKEDLLEIVYYRTRESTFKIAFLTILTHLWRWLVKLSKSYEKHRII